MAFIGTGEQIADWLSLGLHGTLAIVAHIMMTRHIIAIDHPNPLTRMMHKKMFSHFLAVEWLCVLTNFGEVFSHLFFDRGDGLIVSYLPVITNIIIYSIMAHMITVYLRHDPHWVDVTQWQLAGSMLCYLMFAVVFDLSRYLWYAIGVAWMYWVYHIFTCYYRNDHENHVSASTLLLLVWVFLAWSASLLVMPLIGHYGLASVSFTIETWLRNVFTFVAVSIPALYMSFHLHGFQTHLGSMLEERGLKFFASRLKDVGFVGDYLLGHLLVCDGASSTAEFVASEAGQNRTRHVPRSDGTKIL